MGWDKRRKREKNSTPEFRSYPTRARKFEIKNGKKIQKIKKVNSDIISIQNGLGEGKNAKKKIDSWISFILDPWEENKKKKTKKFNKLKKTLSGIIFSQNGVR